jgi:23S rRNA pseudouridine1911/1915/1917 synthase
MGFVQKEFTLAPNVKIMEFLVKHLHINTREAKRMIDRGRVVINGQKVYSKVFKSDKPSSLQCMVFEAKPVGIKPLFQTEDFAIFNKPSGVIIHPNGLKGDNTLLDDVRALFGNGANLVHRIDKETSGLIIASKHSFSESILKTLFEKREVNKSYLALVEGIIDKEITIEAKIATNLDKNIKVKSIISDEGKDAETIIKPLFSKNNQTLVEASPVTGRTHQIRVHLNHIGHRIVGDPLYGVDNDIAFKYLEKTLTKEERISFTGDERLNLHAYKIKFNYRNRTYVFVEKESFKVFNIC